MWSVCESPTLLNVFCLFVGKGWMITGSRVVLERSLPGYVDTEAVLGVSGADILISDIQSVLASVSFLDTGKLSLFTGDGQVVSDVEW